MNKHIITLLLLIIVGGGAGYWLNTQQQSEALPELGAVFPDLKTQGTSIREITLSQGQGGEIRAALEDGTWRISSTYNFPADESKLAELLKSLVAAEKVQAKTKQLKQMHRLGLSAEGEGAATELTVSNGSKSWSLLVGNAPGNGYGRYVRVGNQSQAWLIDQDINLPLSASDWMKQPLLDINTDQIQAVTRPDLWRIIRSEDSDHFTLADLPQGRELKYESVLTGLINNLTNINFETVSEFNPQNWALLSPVVNLDVELENFNSLSLRVAKDDENYFVTVSSEQQGHWDNLVFQISSFTSGQFDKQIEDFLAEPQEPQEILPQTESESAEDPE